MGDGDRISTQSGVRVFRYLFLIGTLAAVQPAYAQDDSARAEELYKNGASLYDEGLYEQAIVAFEASYALSKEPLLFFNIANAYERLGQPKDALEALNKYRPFATADERVTLERRLRALEARIAKQEARDAATAELPPPPPDPAPSVPAEPEPAGRSWVVPAIGGGLLAVGGIVAGVTYAQSRTALANEDEAAWNSLRPVNNAGLVVAGVGAATATVGLAVPIGGKKSASRLRFRRR